MTLRSTLAFALAGLAVTAQAAPTAQWADTVINFSSQWSTGSWSAAQVLGAPNTMSYGDIGTAWAPGPQNGTLEFITVGFNTPTYANGAVIRETYGNGFVYRIDALDTANVLHQVWAGVDNSLPGTPVDFLATWTTTDYLVAGLKIYTDTNHNPSAWEEIDAIQLLGSSVAPDNHVPEPASLGLTALALGLLAAKRRRA